MFSKPYKYRNIPYHVPTRCVNGCRTISTKEKCEDCHFNPDKAYKMQNGWEQAKELALAYHFRQNQKETTEDLDQSYKELDDYQKEIFKDYYRTYFEDEYTER